MNNIGNIEKTSAYFNKNGTEIKKINKMPENNSFADYMKRSKKICSCFSLTEKDLDEFKTLKEVIEKTGASTRCASCLKDLKNRFKN